MPTVEPHTRFVCLQENGQKIDKDKNRGKEKRGCLGMGREGVSSCFSQLEGKTFSCDQIYAERCP